MSERRHRLLVTFELPSFYAEDMTREALADWMKGTSMSYEDALLEEIRIGDAVLVVLESIGEKDSEVVATTGILHSVRVEAVNPSDEPSDDDQWNLASKGASSLRWLAEFIEKKWYEETS